MIRPFKTSSRSRGAVYVFVLTTSLLVTVIGLSVLTVSQINNRATKTNNDIGEAEVLAESAVEFAENAIAADSNWRTTYTSGTATSAKALGHGSIWFKLIDETDGNLANNTTDAIRLYGYGQVGNALRIYSTQLQPSDPPLTCLGVGVAASGTVTLTSLAASGNGTLQSNSAISGSGTLNTISLESAGTISVTGSGTGGRSPNSTARTFPTAATLFPQYTAASMGGTTISFALLPIGASPAVPTISHRLISPSSNPWGSTNTKGVYIFNCGGNSVNITNSRIVGTLVFLNAGTVYLSTSGLFEPGVSNYPVLLVQGNLQINSTTAQLTEASPTPAVNMNPSGTSYPYGSGGSGSNGSTSDTFASSINGLVYASGNISVSNQPVFKGALVSGGTLSATGTFNLTYDSTFMNSAPPGFTGAGEMTPVSGTWRWETAP